jgi:hypothetical protein
MSRAAAGVRRFRAREAWPNRVDILRTELDDATVDGMVVTAAIMTRNETSGRVAADQRARSMTVPQCA